jgi:hypothetical protein
VRVADAYSCLTSVWTDWQGVLANPNYIRDNLAVTWANFRPSPVEDPLYPEDVAELSDEGQYSFQIAVDGSLIQIRYAYSPGDELNVASLAYISSAGYEFAPVGWLRVDFDPSAQRSVLHAGCHMHISLFPEARIQVSGIPNPKQFVEFILATFYPDMYANHRLDEQLAFRDEAHMSSVNSPSADYAEDAGYRYITHMRVPHSPATAPHRERLVHRIRRIRRR